jgi:hypothetical protein
MSEDWLSAPELEQIANRALKFQRYTFRRAWGIYYALWATGITAFAFGGLLLNYISPSFAWPVYALFYGSIGAITSLASA